MSPDTAAHRIGTLLGCLAVDHRIGGLLMLGAAPGLLPAMARGLATAMTGSGPSPAIVTAGSWLGDDDLWLRPRFLGGEFQLAPGLLVEGDVPPVVVVPDLARAGVTVARAAVTLLDAGVATAERHGWSAVWQPRARWIAATDRGSAAGLSPHLLDRFPLRIDAAGVEPQDFAVVTPPGHGRPALDDDVLEEVLRIVGGGNRLRLALARTARALAVLDGAGVTAVDHVRRAAGLLGLLRPAPPAGGVPPSPDEPRFETLPETTPPDEPPAVSAADEPVALGQPADEPELYPESRPDALPERASLRSPWTGISRRQQLRGPRTGSERTRSRFDLAMLPTLLEAAKHRRMRPAADHLIIRPEDWRRYRRGWTPHRLLVLVLDHTCHRDWDWIPALQPYLQWAYTERAAVSVVDLGHEAAANELRAEHYRAPSVRDPRVLRSLRHRPGRATPLAAGLNLAVQELLRRLRRSRAHADRAWLVVVTDGRGNVPLDASLRGAIEGPVGRRGVEDAVATATSAKSVAGLRTVVVAPRISPYAALPFDLADALGGVVIAPAGPS
jgi:magnesium chelatase subunit D